MYVFGTVLAIRNKTQLSFLADDQSWNLSQARVKDLLGIALLQMLVIVVFMIGQQDPTYYQLGQRLLWKPMDVENVEFIRMRFQPMLS